MEQDLSTKVVLLKYFSRFSEITGKASEHYKTEANTLEALWYELDKQYDFGQPINGVRPATNHQFCDWNYRFSDGDSICFIPPVSGG